MQPNDPQDDRSLTVPSRDDQPVVTPGRDAATQLMRDQIDKIYADDGAANEQQAPAKRVHFQTHSDQKARDAAANDEQLKHYHSAWQQYYQQYYERYYLSQLQNRAKPPSDTKRVKTDVGADTIDPAAQEDKPLTREEAVHDIRDQLLGKVKHHGRSVRKSRHFMPLVSAVLVGLIFLLLQYNRIMIAQVKAYVSPGAISPQNIVIDPMTSTKVGPEPKLIIPKINVEAPVVYGLGSLADGPVQKALKDGVVHYPIPGADSLPGQKGNTVILGHSSNDVFDDGAYKFIFVQLEKLQPGDTFYINYDSVRYTYRIKEKKVILPTEVSSLVVQSDKPMATLVTCVPIGTALKRLVVFAEQISPDPAGASTHQSAPGQKPVDLPGNSPTLFERLFGG